MPPVPAEVLVDGLLGVQAQVLAHQFHGDHLAIRQLRQGAALPESASGEMRVDKVIDVAEHGNDQLVELHWVLRPLGAFT